MRELVRKNLRFFLLFSAAALLLRLIFYFRFPGVVTDSFIYGDIAKNWLQHGIYGLSGGEISPTYIRLPGYPAFLAIIFAIFGVDHYRAVLVMQMFVDLGTCFLCAAIALRLLGPRCSQAGIRSGRHCARFLRTTPLPRSTETLEVFFTALTLHLALRALRAARLRDWACAERRCAATILLRPDGACC